MRLGTIVSLLALLTALPVRAEIIISVASRSPTPGLPSYETITLMANSTEGDFSGFNFLDGQDDDFGIFGSFNQLQPYGLVETVWNDTDLSVYTANGMDPPADTHFLPRGLNNVKEHRPETTNWLGGKLTMPLMNRTPELPFVQAVQKIGEPLTYRGQFFVLYDINFVRTVDVSGSVSTVPEPAAIVQTICSLVGIAATRRRAAGSDS